MTRPTQTSIIVLGIALAAAGAWAVYRTFDQPEAPAGKQYRIRDAAAGGEASPRNASPPLTSKGSDSSGDADPDVPLPAELTAQAVPRSRYVEGRLQAKAISESSGIVASRRFPNVFWTHNDSGNKPEIFAVDRTGNLLARYEVDEENIDWEDIAIDDEGHLYVGDVGNNNEARKHGFVYRLDEPDPKKGGPEGGAKLKPTATWKLKYPGGREGRFDSEAFFVWKGKGYLVSKVLTLRYATIYSFDLDPQKQSSKKKKKDEEDDDPKETLTLEPVAEVPIRYPVTGADISRDGSRLAIVTVAGPYVLRIDGNIENAARAKPAHVPYINPREEAICFTDGGVLVTTEDRDILFFPDKLFEGATLPATKPATQPAR